MKYLSKEEEIKMRYLACRQEYLTMADKYGHDEVDIEALQASKKRYIRAEKAAVNLEMRPLMDVVESGGFDESTLRRACHRSTVRSEQRHGRWYVFPPDAMRVIG